MWKGVIGEEDDISPGLPLVRLLVLATAGEHEEEEEAEEEGRGSRVGDGVAGGVLGTPVGDGRRVREYVRSTGAAVEDNLGGDGRSTCADASVVPGVLGLLVVDTEGAGVRGGGGEDVVGVRVGAGESRSMGLGVSLGGVRVEGVEQSGVLVPPATSLCSDWPGPSSSLSILQLFTTLEKQNKRTEVGDFCKLQAGRVKSTKVRKALFDAAVHVSGETFFKLRAEQTSTVWIC